MKSGLKIALAVIVIVIAFTLVRCVSVRAEAVTTDVDVSLITAIDVSSSINAAETILEIEGVADAIRSPEMMGAIRSGERGKIGFAVFLWADGEYPELIPWRVIMTQADADAAADELMAKLQALVTQATHSVGTLTNLSGGLEHAAAMMNASPFAAERRIINVIGNGEDNVGEDPSRIRAAILGAGITINGVVVGGDPAVVEYYRKNVIGGRFAFVLTASKTEDVAAVMTHKFITEIADIRWAAQ